MRRRWHCCRLIIDAIVGIVGWFNECRHGYGGYVDLNTIADRKGRLLLLCYRQQQATVDTEKWRHEYAMFYIWLRLLQKEHGHHDAIIMANDGLP